jgi:glycosyltransferase involved in cell wall biosynthesis
VLVNTVQLSPVGGVEVHTFQVSRELASRGHTVDLVAMGEGTSRKAYESFARSVSVCGNFAQSPFSFARLRHPSKLAAWVAPIVTAVRRGRRLEPEVIYANGQYALTWACAVSRRPEVPIVCHLHDNVGRAIGLQRSLLARRVDMFIAPSRYIRDDWVSNGLPRERVRVIPQAIDLDEYPPATPENRRWARALLGIPEKAFVALFLGRVVPDKGAEVLARAWAKLGLTPDAGRLLIVGPTHSPGFVRHLYDMASAAGCTFMSTQDNVVPLLHAADVVVVPTIGSEAFGRVVIEAMATGCPVVASDVGGIPEILTGRFAGYLFERGNVGELTDRLRAVRRWRQQDPTLAQACIAHVRASYRLEAAVDGIESVLTNARKRRWRDR